MASPAGSGYAAPGVSAESDSSARQELSNAIVALYSDRFGRGPTQARSYIEESHALVILGDVQTTVERTLTAHGEGVLVREVRRCVKAAYRDEIVAVAEEATGRRVVAMHSDHDPDTNTSIYAFLFADRA
jgi:uncharacterized protein YbcI